MKVLTNPNQCTVTEVGTNDTYLTTFPKGNKVKYLGKWFRLVDKDYIANAFVRVYESKDGLHLVYRSLPKYIEI